MNKRYQCRSHQGGIFSMPPRRGRPPVRCTPEHPCDRADAAQQVTSDQPNFDAMTNSELKAYAREHFSTITKLTSRASLIRAMQAQLAKRGARQVVTNVVREVPGVGKVAVVTTEPRTVLVKPPTRFNGSCPECGATGGHRATCSHSGRGPERNAEPRTSANDSLPLAMRAKAQLEPLGWTVKGRAWVEGASVVTHHAEVIASRGAETLVMHWVDGVLAEQQYSMEHLKESENGIPPHKLNFNPDEMTDGELVRMLRGMKVTWWNTLGSSTETAIIGPANIAIEHLFVGGGDTDNSKRIIKFLDHSGGGFRAFHVGALLKVG